MCEALTGPLLRAMLDGIAETLAEQAAYLTRLDVAIGDGDHGRNMALGFARVREELHEAPGLAPGHLLRSTGLTLVATVGGASGPLYGAAFIAAGMAARSRDVLTLPDLADLAQEAAAALARRGRCHVGDKTILDALDPAARALAAAARTNRSLRYGLQAATDAARAGMEATVPLVARCGLAMQYGPASAGHQDPGATSCYLMFEAALQTFERLCPRTR